MTSQKGFTLIELLAVIVVLGIVMVIGVTTVLPLLNDTKKEAFATEAKNIISVVSDLIPIKNIGHDLGVSFTVDANDNYCVSVPELISSGLFKKEGNEKDDYLGKVVAEKIGNGKYTYTITMTDAKNYHVSGEIDNLKVEKEIKSSNNYTCTGKSQDEEFIDKVNKIAEAAEKAYESYSNGNSNVLTDDDPSDGKKPSSLSSNVFCITVQQLKKLGFYSESVTDYGGSIRIRFPGQQNSTIGKFIAKTTGNMLIYKNGTLNVEVESDDLTTFLNTYNKC